MNKIIVFIILLLAAVTNAASAQDKHASNTFDLIKNSALNAQIKIELEQAVTNILKKGAPARELEIIAERHLSIGTEPEALNKWLAIIGEALDNRIPAAPIIDKIKEGLSKNIPMVKIESATHLVMERLSRCKILIDSFVNLGKIKPDYDPEIIEIMAETLWRGIPIESLTEMCQLIRVANKKENDLETIKISALSLSKMQSLNIPAQSSIELVKTVLEKQAYHSYYLFDLVEIIKIASIQKKKPQNEIMAIIKNSIVKGIDPIKLIDIMQLGTDGILIIQKELSQTENNVNTSRQHLDQATLKVNQGLENSRNEMERAKEELENNIERMRELKEMLERIRDEIEHLKHNQQHHGE